MPPTISNVSALILISVIVIYTVDPLLFYNIIYVIGNIYIVLLIFVIYPYLATVL